MEDNGANSNLGKKPATVISDMPEPMTLKPEQYAQVWAAALMLHEKRRQAALGKNKEKAAGKSGEGSNSTTGP